MSRPRGVRRPRACRDGTAGRAATGTGSWGRDSESPWCRLDPPEGEQVRAQAALPDRGDSQACRQGRSTDASGPKVQQSDPRVVVNISVATLWAKVPRTF